VEFADRKKFLTLIEEMQHVVSDLVESFKYGNVIRNGVHVAIVGKPNAGKSTLLNSLLNEQRAIVSEIAGTTRDTIEEVLVIEGIEFRLIDTAGIRAHTSDQIEKLGMDRSLEKIEQADIVLEILDAELVEMKRCRSKGLCCGAGGAQMFKEEEKGTTRVNFERTGEALDTGAGIIASACPFCNTMLTDGVKHGEKEEDVKVMDIAELIAASIV